MKLNFLGARKNYLRIVVFGLVVIAFLVFYISLRSVVLESASAKTPLTMQKSIDDTEEYLAWLEKMVWRYEHYGIDLTGTGLTLHCSNSTLTKYSEDQKKRLFKICKKYRRR